MEWRRKVAKKAGITGTGHYVPEKILTNFDLEKMVDTSDEWIRTRSGIEERRIAASGEYTSDLGVKAAEKAIEAAGISKDEIDLIITTTITPDYVWPATACVIASKMGMQNIPAFDMSAACSGFIYGLANAKAFVEAGIYKKVLLICPEKFSAFLDWTDRNTCVLMADGAGAAVISEAENEGIMSVFLGADGSHPEWLYQPGGGSVAPFNEDALKEGKQYMHMNGKEIYKNAVEKMPMALEKAMEAANVSSEDIDFVIFHQANIRIIQSIAKKFNWPDEKNIINIQKYGNTSAATIPIALDEAIRSGKIKKGSTVAFSAFGGGLTWAGAVVKI